MTFEQRRRMHESTGCAAATSPCRFMNLARYQKYKFILHFTDNHTGLKCETRCKVLGQVYAQSLFGRSPVRLSEIKRSTIHHKD